MPTTPCKVTTPSVLQYSALLFCITHLDDNEEFEEKETVALFHVKHKVVMETDLKMEEITKGRMLRLLESYIRRDILDTSGHD